MDINSCILLFQFLYSPLSIPDVLQYPQYTFQNTHTRLSTHSILFNLIQSYSILFHLSHKQITQSVVITDPIVISFIHYNIHIYYLCNIMTFRSQELAHYQLLFPREIAWEVANQLGRLATLHLEDLSDPINHPFLKQVKRCDESLYKIHSIMSFMKKKKIVQQTYRPELNPNFMDSLLSEWEEDSNKSKVNPIKKIQIMEEKIDSTWTSYQQLTSRLDRLTSTMNLNKGKMAVFTAASIVLGKNYFAARNNQYYNMGAVQQQSQFDFDLSGLSYFVSIVKPEQQSRITKMVFRVSRGYAWTNFIHKSRFQGIQGLEDFHDSVLFLFYPQSSQGTVAKKLQRIVQTFSIDTIQLPSSEKDFSSIKGSLNKQAKETKELLQLLEKQIQTFFDSIKTMKALDEWYVFFLKQRSLYQSLNKMEIRDQFLTCRFYIPKSKVSQLDRISRMTPTPIFNQLSLRSPPSIFQTNLFTEPGQVIVQTYGVPRYGQINPGIFTCVTFPFLFGVMFGDIAHGFVLFMLGLFLVLGADKLRGTVFNGLLSIRYMIILMGFFAFYCGFIYNDFMGLGFNLFGSCYDIPMYGPGTPTQVYPRDQNCVYPVGVDPVWYRAQNQLMFINSLKMKLSVIIGVIHMTFGIALKAVNSLYFKKTLDFYFEFIPQIIFMVLLFGYMDFLIVFKWLKYWEDTSKAPSIINTLINLPLKLGKTTYQLGGMNMWGNSPDDTSQNSIQLFILLISVICIPIMLIPKPWIQIRKMKKQHIEISPLQQQLLNGRQSQITQQFQQIKEKRNSDFVQQQETHGEPGQIVVHQIIQTIEFVLGCISNTASYLRLWALSLAHSQLARVFFSKTIQSGFQIGYSGIAILIFGFYMLSYITFGVLMCMDSMQCFLHSLRLHWVQFQNKFFKADGIKFQQFSFKKAVEKAKAQE